MSGGNISLSWGRWGGFYVFTKASTALSGRFWRVCFGWAAVTYIPMEIDELLAEYLNPPPHPVSPHKEQTSSDA